MQAGFITGALDATTTELADELVGGVLSAGPDRLEMAGALGIPQVVSLGALDMCNFGPAGHGPRAVQRPQPLRAQRHRHAHADDRGGVRRAGADHRPQAQRGHGSADRVHPPRRRLDDRRPRRARSTTPAADAALIRELKAGLRPDVEVVEMATDINDPAFATAMAERLDALYRAWAAREGAGRQEDAHVNGQEALARLRSTLDEGGVIMGAGAGTGLSAKCAEAGGADLIIIYNSGRYRMAGRGSLAGCMPYGDANAIVMEMAGEVLPIVQGDAGPGRRLRHRPVPPDAGVPRGGQARRVLRGPELPHGRAVRRPVPPEPRRDRDGLRPRGRHDRGRPRRRAS